jgi:hypothetical protein
MHIGVLFSTSFDHLAGQILFHTHPGILAAMLKLACVRNFQETTNGIGLIDEFFDLFQKMRKVGKSTVAGVNGRLSNTSLSENSSSVSSPGILFTTKVYFERVRMLLLHRDNEQS